MKTLWTWHHRFFGLAKEVATWSKDPSTQTGAVIVRPDKTIVSIGFNGFARGMNDTEERYADRETKYALIIHCEINAILSARQSVQGCTLYTWPFLTCDRCAIHMIQAGIKRVVAPFCPPDKAVRWEESFKKTRAYYKEAGVECLEIPYE